MSRYLILVILNFPLVVAGILNAIVAYKLKRINQRRLIIRAGLWTSILVGLIFAEPLYRFLFSNNLTVSEPLSLFDVIQITGVVFTFFIANQAYVKIGLLERRVQDLHQELSIRLSNDKK